MTEPSELLARLEAVAAKNAPYVWEAHVQRANVEMWSDALSGPLLLLGCVIFYLKVLPLARKTSDEIDKSMFMALCWITTVCLGLLSITQMFSATMWWLTPDYHAMRLLSETLGL